MLDLFPRDDILPQCDVTNTYNGHSGLRILSVFIILISSGLGVFFPILASRYSFINLPNWCFFMAKFFGSGVIVSTAFIHLLEPASDALGNECLGGTFVEYPWAFGICLMSLFALFFTEIISHYFVAKSLGDDHDHHGGKNNSDDTHSHVHTHTHAHNNNELDSQNDIDQTKQNLIYTHDKSLSTCDQSSMDTESINSEDEELKQMHLKNDLEDNPATTDIPNNNNNATTTHDKLKKLTTVTLKNSQPGKDHFSHESNHQDIAQIGSPVEEFDKEKYLNQIVAVSILEAGIIFHSVFVGLSLSVSGEEFETLFIVLTFHQMFEGLGLGTRVAETNWPHSKRNTPWLMGLAFTLTSPIAVAIGIGVRHSWVPGSRNALIANGIFDSISSGILIYTGLVELMAHEFLFSNQFKGPDGLKKMLWAYFIMCLGAGLMALLGKWA